MLRVTLLSSYFSQAYISLIGVIMMPIYLDHIGIESFGLIGFFLMLQAWMQLVDMGLTPTLSREMSLFRGGSQNAAVAWQRLHSFEWVLGALSVFCILGFWVSRNWVATDWLKVKSLDVHLVAGCVFLMGVSATLRWMTGLYRACLVGLEKQLRVNAISVLFTTLKFIVVVPLLTVASSPTLIFFVFQVSVSLLEAIVFSWTMYRSLPRSEESIMPNTRALKAMWPTASAMAFITGIWVLLSQADKLILSRILPLQAFGYFTLAISVANGVLMLTPPLIQVLQSRMTILATQGKHDELSDLYRTATQITAVTFFALGGGLALYAKPVLWAWTGDQAIAAKAAPILFWYALSNILVGLLTLPFMLQFAYGYLRLHIIGIIFLTITLSPALVFSAIYLGAVGTGLSLFLAHLLFLLFWIPLPHRYLMRRIVWIWPLKDIFPIAATALLMLWGCSLFLPLNTGRLISGLAAIAAMLFSAVAALLIGNRTRLLIKGLFKDLCQKLES